MSDFDTLYRRTLLDRQFPRPLPQPAADAKPTGRGPHVGGGPEVPAMAMMDTLAGLLKGSVAATLGLPGDIESLVRLLTGGEQRLPTTEDMQRRLPPVVPDGDASRQQTAKVSETLGEFVPVAPVAAAAKAVKAVGRRNAAKAAAGTAAAGASDPAGDRVIRYDAQGNRVEAAK